MKELMTRRLVYVEDGDSMADLVRTMRDQNISSVLVLSKDRFVIGIVTERDIVQKFSLVEKEEKLAAKVMAFMTRPVACARLETLEDDVRDMFFKRRFRHFPVTAGTLHEKDIIGLLTVTDMTAAYLRSGRNHAHAIKREPIVIVARDEQNRKRYQSLFEALKFLPISGASSQDLLRNARLQNHAVLFDIDGFPLEQAKRDLAHLKDHRGVFIILSSQAELVEPLRKMLLSETHFVAMKPLDISYILALLSQLMPENMM